MSHYIWIAPGLAAIFLAVVLARLATRNKRFARESQKLNKQVESFKDIVKNAKNSQPKPAKFEAPSLEQAQSNRRALRRKQAKAKAERQRSLVKRLRGLTSKESE